MAMSYPVTAAEVRWPVRSCIWLQQSVAAIQLSTDSSKSTAAIVMIGQKKDTSSFSRRHANLCTRRVAKDYAHIAKQFLVQLTYTRYTRSLSNVFATLSRRRD